MKPALDDAIVDLKLFVIAAIATHESGIPHYAASMPTTRESRATDVLTYVDSFRVRYIND